MASRRRLSGGAAAFLSIGIGLACAPRPQAPPGSIPSLNSVVFQTTGQTKTVDLRNESSVGQRTVVASVAQAWSVLPAVLAQLEIETNRVDSDEAVMGNTGYRARRIEGERMSRYLDCGRSFGREYADQYSVTLAIMVQLVPMTDGSTSVRTFLDAYARDQAMSGTPVHCITKATLERRIGELVAEKLAS
jgi:hypothetical protein